MNRAQKYPDTSTFRYYNANPKGRLTTDCAVRAICTGTGIPYNDVVMGLAEIQCKYGMDGSSKEGIERYLKAHGWAKHKQPRKADWTKYTGSEFCKMLDKGERVIANIGGHHIVAIVDGKVWDTWNSTDGCIGNYWTK